MDSSVGPNQLAAILRLDADTIALISRHLVASDVLKLITLGNVVLAARLRRGIESLSCTWNASRYMDLSLAFRTATQFPHLTRFEFGSRLSSARYWSPIDWSFLPSRLEHLKLEFADSIAEFLSIEDKDTRWPSLQTLYLHDFTYSEVVSHPKPPSVDLRRLPPLTELSLRSDSRSIEIHDQHLLELPIQLKVLELDFQACHGGRPDTVHGIGSTPLPTLPLGLRRLVLRSKDSITGWHVTATALPRTLQEFLFYGPGPIGINAEVPHASSLNLRGGAAHLTELHTLSVSTAHLLGFGPALADFLPTSLTSLTCMSDSYDLRLMTQVPPYLIPAIRACTLRGPDPSIRQFFYKSGPLRLETLNLGTRSTEMVLPPTLKRLRTLEIGDTALPDGLEELTVMTAIQPTVTSSSWGKSLKVLDIHVESKLPPSFAAILPDTLETMNGVFSRPTWQELVSRLSQPSNNLPNLRKLKNMAPLPYPCMFGLPSRIKALHFTAEPVHLSSLPSYDLGCLESLKVVAQHVGSDWSVRKMLTVILRELPTTLKELHIRSTSLFQARMAISWPPNLFEFTYRYVNAYIGKIPIEESSEFPGPLVRFPESLQRLTIFNMHGLPEECLPPHLSVFQVLVTASNDEAAKYFQSRSTPFTGLQLSEAL